MISPNDPSPSRSGLALTEFFERDFLPATLTGRASAQAASFAAAITWLERSLGRPPIVTDLAAEPVEAVRRLLSDLAVGQTRSQAALHRLTSLSRFAASLGIIATPSVALDPLPPFTLPEPWPADSIAAYYHNEYKPKHLTDADKTQLERAGAAVTRLHSYRRAHVRRHEFTEQLIEQFLTWGTRIGKAKTVTNGYRAELRKIGHACRPTEFTATGRRPEPIGEPFDGSVLDFFQDRYVVEGFITRQSTIEGYRTKILFVQRFWQRWKQTDRPLTLHDLSDTLIAKAMHDRIDRLGQSPTTANRTRRTLLTIWRRAYQFRLVDEPTRYVPKVREMKEEPQAWTREQLQSIFDAAAKCTDYEAGFPDRLEVRPSSGRVGGQVARPVCDGSRLPPGIRHPMVSAGEARDAQGSDASQVDFDDGEVLHFP